VAIRKRDLAYSLLESDRKRFTVSFIITSYLLTLGPIRIFSETPQRQSLAKIFARIDAAGGAEDLLRGRDMSTPVDRDWM